MATTTMWGYGDGGYGSGPYGGMGTIARWWTHRIAAALSQPAGTSVLEVQTWDGAGWVVDPNLTRALVSYTVTYGRRDAVSRTEPITGNLTLATVRVPVPPPVATRIRVALSTVICDALGIPAATGVRFTGEVTDPTVDHGAGLTTLACVGRLGRGYRRTVDGTGWPVEDDADRVSRALTSVGVAVGVVDAGSVLVAAPTQVESVAALVEVTEASALGRVVEQPTGLVDYQDAEHRRGTPLAVTLSSSDVFRQVTWTQRLASLINRVDVKTAAGTVQTVTDTASADDTRYGLWPGATDTALTTDVDAQALGVSIVGRRSEPAWTLPDLTVDLTRTIDVDTLPDVLSLTHGSRVRLTDLPPGFPLPRGYVYVEGYTESATPRQWTLVLSVSDPSQSGAVLRWIDWPETDTYQWQDLAADLTWFDLARIIDPTETL